MSEHTKGLHRPGGVFLCLKPAVSLFKTHEMFRYAIRKKYIEENLADKIVISVKFRQVVKKTWKTETYNSDELADLNKYLDSMYAVTEDTVYLAVK